MLNFVGKFLSNLANKTKVLRDLIVHGTPWHWNDEHQQTFDLLKEELRNVSGLAYFDINKTTQLYVDAGPYGVGSILCQKSGENIEIIAYSSRSLTPVEQRYSQIEREMLAATWAIQHFHIFLYGTTFELFTDHKPLINIITNPRSSPSLRLERLCLRIQPYSFTVKHQKGDSNPSDYLSRHPVKSNGPRHDKVEQYVSFITTHSLPKTLSFEEVCIESGKDKVLVKLAKALSSTSDEAWRDPDLLPFKKVKQELTFNNNVVLRQNRIVLPKSLQARAVELAHKGHLGIVKTKQLIRTKVWFPSIDKLVESHVKKCTACQAATPYSHRDPVQTVANLPTKPFEQLDVDFAGPFPNGKYIFLMVDEFTRYPIAEAVTSTSFSAIKPVLEKTFATFGLCSSLKSDNGPPFNGELLKNFLSEHNVKHIRVTPYWPEANGLIERFVKTLKKSLMCANIETNTFDSQLQEFLMNYRSVPHSTTLKSPFELMFNRKINNYFPTVPEPEENSETQEIDKKKRESNNKFANAKRKTKNHSFKVGDIVLCKQQKKNCLTPLYDPHPYQIIKIAGTQITAQRKNKTIVRNSSFFKIYQGRTPFSPVNRPPHKDTPRNSGDYFIKPTTPVTELLYNKDTEVNNGTINSKSSVEEESPEEASDPEYDPDSDASISSLNEESTVRKLPIRERKLPKHFNDFEME